jgi:hypothetical protein
MSFFSENEIYSIEDIMDEFGLERTNPLVYGLYLSRNPDLSQDEKDDVKGYMNKLIYKQKKINQKNIEYMEKHLREA